MYRIFYYLIFSILNDVTFYYYICLDLQIKPLKAIKPVMWVIVHKNSMSILTIHLFLDPFSFWFLSLFLSMLLYGKKDLKIFKTKHYLQ